MAEATDEITVWMQELAGNSPIAAEKLWAHYYEKLVRYASRKLGDTPRRVADEEDVALSAIHSLHAGLEAGRFPVFNCRDDLWKILLTITSNKARKAIRREMAQKRGGGAVRGESIFANAGDDGAGIETIAEPTPEFADKFSSACGELLEALEENLRRIALWKLQGYSNAEIATELGCSVRSVERKLNRIRNAWSDVE